MHERRKVQCTRNSLDHSQGDPKQIVCKRPTHAFAHMPNGFSETQKLRKYVRNVGYILPIESLPATPETQQIALKGAHVLLDAAAFLG